MKKKRNYDRSPKKKTQDNPEQFATDSEAGIQTDSKSVKHKKMLASIFGLVVLLVVGGGVYTYYRQHQNGQISNGTGASSQSQIDVVVSKVGKLILLPSGEQPTMAIVNDVSKYSSVPFFKNAANGDRLLIYAQAREAILYRPSINKIIVVAPLNVDTLQN